MQEAGRGTWNRSVCPEGWQQPGLVLQEPARLSRVGLRGSCRCEGRLLDPESRAQKVNVF